MANSSRYTFQVGAFSEVEGALVDNGAKHTFSDVAEAKTIIDFSGWDFTGLSPVYTLEDSDQTLVVTIPFPDTEAGITAMNNFKENTKNNSAWQTVYTASAPYTGISGEISNTYIVNDVDLYAQD